MNSVDEPAQPDIQPGLRKNAEPVNFTLGNIMSAIVFDSGDKPFMEWMAANPDGFVLNTHPIGGSSYIRFHRATCRHIGRPEIARANAYTTNAYIKVCSNNLSDLIDWATTNRKGATAYVTCKTCGVQWTPPSRQ